MARYKDAKCRLCRREGIKLFLKGERCYGSKCPIDRKGAGRPGQHGQKRQTRQSDYGKQLREKQKAKRIYGVMEKQFKKYFDQASADKEKTGEKLLQFLERRLDNTVYRLNLAPSRSMARQLVSHGHILVDGKKVNVPSYQLSPGQTVSLASKGLKIEEVKKSLADKDKKPPSWLKRKVSVGRFERMPEREEIDSDIDEHLIIEFYSR